MSAKPLRYRLNADGSFTLYSVGEDGRDDGGDPNSASGTNKFGLWEGRDAVWRRRRSSRLGLPPLFICRTVIAYFCGPSATASAEFTSLAAAVARLDLVVDASGEPGGG